MSLEAVLYFVLGFLCAGLLALMVSPLIWNRAVVLTRRKIESSVPLTLNEIQAEKDQLRAEFAMSTRKLEINIDQLREKLAAQSIEVNQKRDQVNKLNLENQEYSKNVDLLKDERIALTAQANEASAEKSRIKEKYDELLAGDTEATAEMQALLERKAKIEELEELVNSQRIEIAAKDTKIEALNESIKHSHAMDEGFLADEVEKLNGVIANQRVRNADLESKLDSNAQKFESVADQVSDQDIKKAVDVLKDNLKLKSDKIIAIEKERDALIAEVKALSTIAKDEWADERKNSAIIRERINDMAAKVAVLAQELEGDNSPISEIIAREPASKQKAGSKSSGSLAKRIQALQETAPVN